MNDWLFDKMIDWFNEKHIYRDSYVQGQNITNLYFVKSFRPLGVCVLNLGSVSQL